MDVPLDVRSSRVGARALVAGLLIASLVLLSACSSSSNDNRARAEPTAVPQTGLMRWKQCLARHGVVLPAARSAKVQPKFTGQQLIVALKRSKALRLKFVAALLKAPKGAAEARYKAAANACLLLAARTAA